MTPRSIHVAKKAILIVDDHPLVRRGLGALINSEPDLSVCAEADGYASALEALEKHQPDLVIIDLALGDDDGIDLIKAVRIRFPKVHRLVLSMRDEEVYAERCLRAGASGYVSKDQLDDTVLFAIRRLLDGEQYLSDRLLRRFAARYLYADKLESNSLVGELSDRELQVFRLIGKGRTTREVAEILHLSVKTVESHREHIKHKLELNSSAELAQRATQWIESLGHKS